MATRGERLGWALEQRNIKKQQALAAELEVHESSITRWKDDAPMSLGSAMALATTLDISLDWLLLGRGTIDSHKSSSSVSNSTYDQNIMKLSKLISQRSFQLLATAVESIAQDNTIRP